MCTPDRDPPRLAAWLLCRFLSEEEIYEKLGDLEEGFRDTWSNKNRKQALSWYRRQVLRIIPMLFKNMFYWSFAMLKNYLKIALRNIQVYAMQCGDTIGIGLAQVAYRKGLHEAHCA